MCRFEIWVERICKDIVKAFPKGYTGVKQLKNNVVGLLGYQVKRVKGGVSHSYTNKI